MTLPATMPQFAYEDWPNHYARQVWVSHFPRWLDEAAFVAEPFVYFGEAKSKGMIDAFLPVEANFMPFYRRLIGDGPLLYNQFHGRLVTGEYRIRHVRRYDKQLERRLRKQIREETRLGLFDEMLVPGAGVHIAFNHDMTHIVYLADPDSEAAIETLARDCGLHILRR